MLRGYFKNNAFHITQKYKTAEDKHNKLDNWSKQGPIKIKVARNVLKRKKSKSCVDSNGGQFLVPKTMIHT